MSHRKRRCADFVDLKKMVTLAEAGVKQDPKRISGAPFWYEEHGSSARKGSDVRQSPICWINCVKILMYSYVLVSSLDPGGEEWCTLDGMLSRLNQVEAYARLDSKAFGRLHNRLVEAESTIRHEWHRVAQQDREISLHDAIELGLGTHIPLLHSACSLNSISTPLLLYFPRSFGCRDSLLRHGSSIPDTLCVSGFRDDFQKRSVAVKARI